MTFEELFEHQVLFDAMLQKSNMVLAGVDCPFRLSVAQIAEETLNCLLRAVPAAVPGIVFLSGGQSDVQATENLNAINRLNDAPWQVSFSFGRALQNLALKTWRGSPGAMQSAQRALYHRAHCNSGLVLAVTQRRWRGRSSWKKSKPDKGRS